MRGDMSLFGVVNPGTKPVKELFIYADKIRMDDGHDLQELVSSGYRFVEIEYEYGEPIPYAKSGPYMHHDLYERALENWKKQKDRWDEWLKTDAGSEHKLLTLEYLRNRKEEEEKSYLFRINEIDQQIKKISDSKEET